MKINDLENDVKLKELDLENEFDLLIHLPEQLLQAWELSKKVKINAKIDTICLFHQNSDLIFEEWLSIALSNKLELKSVCEDHLPEENELFICCKFSGIHSNKFEQSILFRTIDSRDIIDFSNIVSFDGKSLFLGSICSVLEHSGLVESSFLIKPLIAMMVQKAGALTWRTSYEKNFAKIWAAKLVENGLQSVSGIDKSFNETAKFWEKAIFDSGISKGKREILLTTLQDKMYSKDQELIFADGRNKLENLVTLYQLGLIISIYCKILIKS